MRTRTLPGSAGNLAPARVFSIAGFFHRIFHSASLRRERRRLAQLDPHLLRDIGVSQDAAIRESKRKDWDAPDRWTR